MERVSQDGEFWVELLRFGLGQVEGQHMKTGVAVWDERS